MLRKALKTFTANSPLWRNADYMKLFTSNTLTTLGGTVSQMALPLTAIDLLHANATKMGWLTAAELAPFALFSLPAGVWIDRSRKKQLASLFEIISALALMSIPIAYLLGVLNFSLIMGVGFVIGCGYAIGGTAMQVYVNQLVGKEHLVEGIGKLQAASSIAGILGPPLAAVIVAAVGAPLAIACDAICFVVSFGLLLSIKRDDLPAQNGEKQAFWTDIRLGLAFVWESPTLRALAIGAIFWVALFDGFRALYVLFASHDLELDAHGLAVVNTCGAVGALLSASIAPRLEKRFGARHLILAGYLLSALGYAAYACVPAQSVYRTLLAGGAMWIIDAGATLYVVPYLSLRQQVTPDAMLGRMIATMRCVSVTAAPFGASLAGHMGDSVGIQRTLLALAALGISLTIMAAWRMPRLEAPKTLGVANA
ncbi:MFS transporter [Uliginosibacterium gangwonense]|uniref:MFS transporter n=1 Tax=Uliginosibacterium gangwonense TaxID=392736 RepID=UPI00036FD901|nr:MFS transporter [Uliginosibacterium gangwonense]